MSDDTIRVSPGLAAAVRKVQGEKRFTVGDRVRWANENGAWTGEVRSREPWGLYIREDTSGGMMAFSSRTLETLRRIVEPQEWQGECANVNINCHAAITAATACIYTPDPEGPPLYLCLDCWTRETEADNRRVSRQQAAGDGLGRIPPLDGRAVQREGGGDIVHDQIIFSITGYPSSIEVREAGAGRLRVRVEAHSQIADRQLELPEVQSLVDAMETWLKKWDRRETPR